MFWEGPLPGDWKWLGPQTEADFTGQRCLTHLLLYACISCHLLGVTVDEILIVNWGYGPFTAHNDK
jgi:hypothetical protein